MNSKKLEKFVQKIVDAKSAKKFAKLVNLVGILKCYISDVDNRHAEETGYEILMKHFGESVMEEPEATENKLSALLCTELTGKYHDVFETYKIVYTMKLCGYTELNERIPFKNVVFAWNLLEKADYTDDISLFEACKMLDGFTFD